MLSKSNGTNRDQLEMVSLDEMIPEDHLVRKLEKAIDFSYIYDLVEDLYFGPWPSQYRSGCSHQVAIFPIHLWHPFDAPDDFEEVNTNLAYR